ncbi:MAG: acyl-ACP--UDP-N-acetylglucosamine O-acyltransferase [Bacteroidota bacterium]|jgi:UDP-N-acetylglucosamine acyltransferase
MIHQLTNIHPNAIIGKNTQIGAFTTIEEDVIIGEDCWIASNVVIMNGARIGNNVKIFPSAVISAAPQDLKYKGEKTIAVIGDNSIIREFVTINKGTIASGRSEVGKNCLLMAYVHVAHDCIIGNNCILANCATLAGHIIIEDYAIIGGMSAVHQFVNIGSHVMISGGSLVRKDVPPFVKAAREPLSYVGINSIGLTRRGFSEDAINSIRSIYRILFQQNKNIARGVAQVLETIPQSAERDSILSFIEKSERGVMKGYESR